MNITTEETTKYHIEVDWPELWEIYKSIMNQYINSATNTEKAKLYKMAKAIEKITGYEQRK